MNDEEFELQKKRIQVLTERWVKPLGMNWGRIHFVYHRDSGDFQEQREKYCDTSKDGSGRGLAFCTSDWRYAESTIQFNLLVVAGEDDDALEEFYVHELMHVFLSEMRESGIDHEERVATTLAKAFVWLRDALLEKREQPAISSEVPTC
jgi:hypothetical protein